MAGFVFFTILWCLVTLCVVVLLAFMLCFMVSCANTVLLKITADKAKADKIDFFMFLNFLGKYGFWFKWFR